MNEIIERKSWFLSVMPWKLKMFFVCCGNQLKKLIDNNIRTTQIFQSHRKLLGKKYQTYRLVPRVLIMTHWEVFIKLSTINLNIFLWNFHEEEQLEKQLILTLTLSEISTGFDDLAKKWELWFHFATF